MVRKFLCVPLPAAVGRKRNNSSRQPSCHQEPSLAVTPVHPPPSSNKLIKQQAPSDQKKQWRRLFSLPSLKARIKRRASVSSSSTTSGSAKEPECSHGNSNNGGNNKRETRIVSGSPVSGSSVSLILSHGGKNSATFAVPISTTPVPVVAAIEQPADLPLGVHDGYTRTFGGTNDNNAGATSTTTSTTSTKTTTVLSKTTCPCPYSYSTPPTHQDPSLVSSSYSSLSSSEHACTNNNNHGVMQLITESLDQRLHEQNGHERHQQRQMQLQLQQRMEHHEHEIPEDAPSTQQQQQQEGRKYHHNKDASEQKQEQKQKQAQEHNQERREEMIVNTRPREKEGDDTVTMAVFVSSDDEEGEGPCGGGTPVAKEGGKSMPIHAGLVTWTPIVHLTTSCSSGAAQDKGQQHGHGHVSSSLLHHPCQPALTPALLSPSPPSPSPQTGLLPARLGNAMWLAMTESVSHEAGKEVGEDGESPNRSAHGVLHNILDTPAATKASLSSPPPRPCSSTSPMPSADTTDYFDRSGTNGTKTQDPVIRFEMVERLGYGSGGSSVYKARDKLEGLKMVAIKKIPLSTLAGVSGDHKSSGTTTATATQSDVDYYMACIADYTKDNGYHNINMNMNLNTDNANGHDNKDNNNNNNNNTSMMNGVHLGSRDSSTAFWDREGGSRHAQTEIRISTKIGKPTRHRDRIVQCLGCHPTENELWLSLEFCGGGSVEDLIRLSDGPLTESEIGWIMSQVLLGVEFLHSKDHVHGDIKASNILLMVDGHVKLGGSGSVLDHKTGAGERRRRRRALTMAELPLSWLAPEATPILSNPPGARVPRDSASIPFASAETDIWALGIACIELFQGRPPKPDTPILKWLEEPRFAGQTAAGNYMGGFSTPLGMTGNVTGGSIGGWGSIQTGVRDFRTEMSEEMWSFVGRCLTPDPMARPRVRDLLEDAFILKYNRPSAELQERIQRMMEFVDQCAFISSDRQSNDSMSISSPSSFSSASTLSPTSPTFMDLRLQEANIGPWLIPMVRPRVDLVYDASTFFDEAGLPMSPPDPDTTNTLSSWKHQRASHPVVKQALKCEQAGYMIFRHSRSPSLATIVESQLEDDPYQFIRDVGGRPRMDYGGRSLDLLYA